MWLTNPDNGYDENMTALKSLQSRMTEIRHMNMSSFEYQQAIQQITQQEQNEAYALTRTFEGLWYMKYHFMYWDWMELLVGTMLVLPVFILWSWVAMEDYHLLGP